MKAVEFNLKLPRYGYTKVAGMINQKEFYGPRSCLGFNDVPEPEIRGPHWVKLRSVLSGFCGSDLGLVMLHDSPTTQPFASFPFTVGHEIYAVVEEVGSEVRGLQKGDRAIINPPLGCVTREIDPVCGPCSRGETMMCENIAEGALAPGLAIGYCTDTGGGWGKYFVAHDTQVIKAPSSITDEQVVMMEPLCSSLYPTMRALPREGEHVLVVGCGVIGLGVIASIRALGIDCHITAVEPTPLNAEKATEKGADEVINPAKGSLYDRTVAITGAKRYKPMIAKQICMGGFDRIFDCVGSTQTINDSFRVAAGGATYVLIGITIPGRIDWAPVWMKGLNVIGNLGYGNVDYQGKTVHTFDMAIDLVKNGKVDMTDIITHRFSLNDYIEAIEVNMHKAANKAIKSIFDLSDQ